MRGRVAAVLLFMLMQPTLSLAAERIGVACPFTSDDALVIAAEQLQELYETRAVARPPDVNMPASDFVESLDFYLNPEGLETGKSGGLLFYVSQGDAVCVMFARPTGRALSLDSGATTRLTFDLAYLGDSASALPARIDAQLAMLLGSAKQPARSPQLREPPAAHSRSAAPIAGKTDPATDPAEIISALGEMLIPSRFAGEIEALDHLTIVPALNLGRVPFGALDPDSDGNPLMDHVVINVESSLMAIFERRVFGWDATLPIAPVILGDPDATDDPQWLLPRLPGAGREAADIAALLQSSAATGAEATAGLLLQAQSRADYIHIAAHGIADAQSPMDNSFLALSGGRLTARQIQAMRLEQSPIVVLSACQSGLGGPIEAGIIGVARGFVLAGASNVVASLWNVDDEATAWIMLRFVENLARTTPADALRLAQLEARPRWPSPAIWAAFISFGARFVKTP